MNQTDAFFDLLHDWKNKQFDNPANDYDSIIFVLVNELGITTDNTISYDTNQLETTLKNRINYLITQEKINEDLLIMGLVSVVTNFISNTVYNHITNAKIYMKMIEKHDNPDAKNKLKILLSPDYKKNANKELHYWHTIVNEKMDFYYRDIWKSERVTSSSFV